ncbi:MAG: 30S ribosomal protein S12 methylthiotransferase RimO [Actinomycetota bacterium]|nr:30S ribosomal protein S12 methylthiotransferase RimO [Actinomycetota bacterium]
MIKERKGCYLLTLGCPKNEVDSDCLASALERAGWRMTDSPRDAAVMILNTCSFIVPAVEESLESVMELSELREGGARPLVVTGCLVSRYGGEVLAALLPEVDLFVGFDDYPHFAGVINALLDEGGEATGGALARERASTLDRGYVYLKISEGCGRRCAYCAIPSIRGPLCSRTREAIVEEASFFLGRGAMEVVLIAQDTTSYGIDIYGRPSLPELLGDLCAVAGDWRLRVMYMHPEGVDARVLEAMSDPRICRYLDLPFQHVDAGILGVMGRKGSADSHRELLRKAEEVLGEVALRATFMTGFPGEDARAFAMLRDFVAAVRFDWLGLFSYSHEEGTPAFSLREGVSTAVARKRCAEIAVLQEEIMLEKAGEMVGRRMQVLIEGVSAEAPGFWEARSQREAPEIDGVIFVPCQEDIEAGTLRDVKITASEGIDLIGAIEPR